MAWETITTSEKPNPASPRFRSQALNDAVERRLQANAKKLACTIDSASGTLTDKIEPPALHAAGRNGKVLTEWKPPPFPKPNPGDYVVVVKPLIAVSNADTTETLRESVRWRSGTIVEVRKFGTSNKARATFAGKDKPRFIHYDTMLIPLQPYYRTIPACDKCGVIGHRKDTCPNPRPDTCGLCSQQVPLVEEGVRAPHECVPVCSVCGGAHATNSRAGTAKYRNPKTAAKQGRKSKRATKKRRQLQAPSEPPCRDIAKTDKPGAPTGGVGKQSSTPPPPHGGTGKQPTSKPTEAIESEMGAPATDAVAALEARMNTLEVRLDSRITVLKSHISAAVNAAIAKMTEAIPTVIAQQVARFNKRAGPIQDVSGRYLKTSRRQTELEDDESCPLSGVEDNPLPASTRRYAYASAYASGASPRVGGGEGRATTEQTRRRVSAAALAPESCLRRTDA
ncbi:hypothetical protein HPB50_025227 [Hyalomma asiaticum]|uniref:Uncharacterized protein n=1 Tax=Hyalomma asiaticum TaxID=266040 RepID=A0ACB7TR50_HYAAI|nr:hypothetical protein HPB50_025227 [Hyalomma asiaticum]